MKIHAMCLVKNEADVIEECLRAAAKWADVYVMDNGSTDGTWEIVQRLARELPQIGAWKQDPKPFRDSLRGEIYSFYHRLSKPGDWWCVLDADEFYVDSPRSFLTTIPKDYGVVWYAPLAYFFSSAAAAEYEQHPKRFADSVPVADRCRYYKAEWSEIRFVRHEVMARNQYTPDTRGSWPYSIHSSERHYPHRILCKHYAYRSPDQIQRRIDVRLQAFKADGRVFQHEAIGEDWRSRITPVSTLTFDAHDGNYSLDVSRMPAIPVPQTSIASDAWRLVRRVLGNLFRGLKLSR